MLPFVFKWLMRQVSLADEVARLRNETEELTEDQCRMREEMLQLRCEMQAALAKESAFCSSGSVASRRLPPRPSPPGSLGGEEPGNGPERMRKVQFPMPDQCPMPEARAHARLGRRLDSSVGHSDLVIDWSSVIGHWSFSQ
jgi:hypothetical protein